uniref:Uncharacterized protein n=1 Tax=Anguilla anguilla TaxID=7936 RepID=A0A0E9RXE6_ANGAN
MLPNTSYIISSNLALCVHAYSTLRGQTYLFLILILISPLFV